MDSDFAQPRRIPRLQIALELSVILIALFIFTTPLQNLSADTRIQGVEFSYLINSGAIAHEIFQDTGAIPLWNPFIGRGEPLIENPFSYVLNPLMSIPVIGLGPAQGAKIAVLMHIGLMALGGWTLADSLRMGAAGRLLLALLLAGNGSFTGAIGEGFYQMSLSQTYAPLIYTGLIGVLYRRDRAAVGVFAVFSALMVFAGTFWYVLPTAIGVIVISAFALIGAGDRRFRIESVKRLLWVGALTIGLTAIRTLPQAVHRDLIIHPNADLDAVTDFFGVVRNYIETTVQPAPDRILNAIDYHYILSPLFGVFVLMGWIAIRRIGFTTRGRKRIVIPAITLIALFTLWAQGGIAPVRWLYGAIPLLDEWRLTGRMLAAATPLIALLLALAFDDIVSVVRRQISQGAWRYAALAALVIIGALASADVLTNWSRTTGVIPAIELNQPAMVKLREVYPRQFLEIDTRDFYDFLPFYESLARARFGNPDYRPAGISPTIGNREPTRYLPEFGIAFQSDKRDYLIDNGYTPINEAGAGFEALLWRSDLAPTFAYLVAVSDIDGRFSPLTRADTTPITIYDHRIDEIHVTLDDYADDSLLVVSETAYPGWRVTINSEDARLESIGELLGVRLPDDVGGTLEIVFAYRPRWLYVGSAITALMSLIATLYLLQVDKRLRQYFYSARFSA
jgi:hypothetical protein